MFIDDYITATKFLGKGIKLDHKALHQAALSNVKRMNLRTWSVDAALEQWIQSGQTDACEAKSDFAVVSLWAHDTAFLRSFLSTMSDFMQFEGTKPTLSIFRTDNHHRTSLEELLPSWMMFTMDKIIARNPSTAGNNESSKQVGSRKVLPEQ